MLIFGSYLLQQGVLTRAQLEEATQSQVVFGGRLGTNLVELGYLRLDELERHLAVHLGTPVAPAEWVEHLSPEALAAVPAPLAGRHGILPLALEKRTLHLAMLDPRDPRQVDDIAFATGLRIKPYVMSELRLSALLEHHYAIPRDTRYITLGPEAARGRHARAEPEHSSERVQRVLEAEPSEGAVDLGMNPLDAGQELIDEETFSSLHERWQGAPAPAQQQPPVLGVAAAPGPTGSQPQAAAGAESSSAAEHAAGALAAEPEPAALAPTGAAVGVAALEAELAAARDRDTVGRIALRIARLHASAAALFVVRGGMVSGFLGDGEGMDANLDGILIPAEAETIFSRPATARTPYRGQPPTEGIDARVLGALSRSGIRDAVVIPISVRDRAINLLYADNGSAALGETSVAALAALCKCVGRSYERLILERKGKFA